METRIQVYRKMVSMLTFFKQARATMEFQQDASCIVGFKVGDRRFASVCR